MDDNTKQYFEKVETILQEEFIKAQNYCVLCGSALVLQHIRMDEIQEIQEDASCCECDIKTRVKNYTIQ